MENNTAKHFALQLGSLISLYLSLTFLLVLIFGVINIIYPDAIEGSWAIESASSSIRLGLAMVLVFFPTYLTLTRLVNQSRRKETDGKYLTLTKWLIYLSLIVGGGVLLGDLVAIIMAFLEGELTTRFILKALAVALIVGPAFYYYLQDSLGFWMTKEKTSTRSAYRASLVVIVTLVFGFINIETPAEVREKRLDSRQISDLQDIQSRVVSFHQTNSVLPTSLDELLEVAPLPTAPEDRPAYKYTLTANGFELCAEFAYASSIEEAYRYTYLDPEGLISNPNSWEHRPGNVCFERVLNTAMDN